MFVIVGFFFFLGWLWSVNPVKNLCSLCGFLLKSDFLENVCFVGQQLNPSKGCLMLVHYLLSW